MLLPIVFPVVVLLLQLLLVAPGAPLLLLLLRWPPAWRGLPALARTNVRMSLLLLLLLVRCLRIAYFPPPLFRAGLLPPLLLLLWA